MSDALRTSYHALHEILLNPDNPKDHDLGKIHGSFARFGYVNPIVIDGVSGVLVAGHGRVKALMQKHAMGDAPPRYIRADDKGEWYVPAVYVDFQNMKEATAYIIADNQTTIAGGWHDETLAQVLQDLVVDTDQKLEGTGFDTEDLDKMLEGLGQTLAEANDETCPCCGQKIDAAKRQAIIDDPGVNL